MQWRQRVGVAEATAIDVFAILPCVGLAAPGSSTRSSPLIKGRTSAELVNASQQKRGYLQASKEAGRTHQSVASPRRPSAKTLEKSDPC